MKKDKIDKNKIEKDSLSGSGIKKDKVEKTKVEKKRITLNDCKDYNRNLKILEKGLKRKDQIWNS